MEEREEMRGVGIRHLDFAELAPVEERVSLPIKRYAPRGRQRKERPEVRNSLASAIAIRDKRGLTNRDYDLLHTLLILGVMSTNQIQRLYWSRASSSKVVTNRLGKLWYRHLVNLSPDCQEYLGKMGMKACSIYTLGKVGAAALYMHYGANRRLMSERKRYQIGKGAALIYHDILVSEIYVRFVKLMQGRKNLFGWLGESQGNIVEAGGRELVRPDGTVTVGFPDGQAAFAIELDRGGSKWDEKVRAYDSVRDRQRWNQLESETPYLDGVLIVVGKGRGSQAREWIQAQGKLMPFYLKTWSEFVTLPIDEGWLDVKSDERTTLQPECLNGS